MGFKTASRAIECHTEEVFAQRLRLFLFFAALLRSCREVATSAGEDSVTYKHKDAAQNILTKMGIQKPRE